MSTQFENIDAVKMYVAKLNHINWKTDFIEDANTVTVNGIPVVAAYKFTSKRNDLTEKQKKGHMGICKYHNGVDCWVIAPNGMCVRL